MKQIKIFSSLVVFLAVVFMTADHASAMYQLTNQTEFFSGVLSHLDDTKGNIATYDYAPAAVYDGTKYRVWWCGGRSGDTIYYSEASSLSGPWSVPIWVFEPTRDMDGSKFDSLHTCDPSIVKVGGQYHLYYGGLAYPGKLASDDPNYVPNIPTEVGLADSANASIQGSFSRQNSGLPIVTPHDLAVDNYFSNYGAGQPSVIYLEGYYYMLYTDTTGQDPYINSTSGNESGGVYILRSLNPLFQDSVEELTASGFQAVSGKPSTSFNLLNFRAAASVDWVYSDKYDIFLVAANAGVSPNRKTSVYMFDRNFHQVKGIQLDVPSSEGPDFLRDELGHVPNIPGNSNQICIFNPDGPGAPNTWDIGYMCVDLTKTPTVTSQGATSIGSTAAIGNGNIVDIGDDNPDRSIEWGTTSGNYTNSCDAGAGGIGYYSCNLTSLITNTKYYYRTKATNSAGTSYGSETTFTTLAISPDVVSPPIATPNEGVYNDPQMVALSSETSGAIIRYTTDGTTPTASSSAYFLPIAISKNTTLKTLATKSGMTDSSETDYNYIINNSDSGGKKKEGKKKEIKKKRTIKNSETKLHGGDALYQSGKRFSKSDKVALYFARYGGGYYDPEIVTANSKGNFGVTYIIPKNKPAGTYGWYALDLKTKKKSRMAYFSVK